MKKTIVLFAAILMIACLIACASKPNPNAGPELKVTLPELFTPNPDAPRETMTASIEVIHPVAIKDWTITVQPRRARQQTAQPAERQPAERQQAEGETRARPESETPRQRRAFYEQTGTKNPPKAWQWNGRGTNGELVQSAMDYQFTLTVNDIHDNSSTYEGVISIGIIVHRDGDDYRMAVPSIIFPPNSADFGLLSDEERRANNRVLRLVARALERFEDYKITVEGHANPTTPPGTPARDTEETGTASIIGLRPLSEQRARAVVDFLVADAPDEGDSPIDRSRLTAIGVGGTRTVADWDDEDENWKNRRVEFILKK